MARRYRTRFAKRKFSKLHTCKDPLKYRIGYMSGNVAKRCEVPKEAARDWLIRQCSALLGKPCKYCHREVTIFNFSIDHSKPISRGGERGLDNCTLICKTCNLTKGDFTHDEFERIVDFAKTGGEEFHKHFLGKLRMGGIIFNRGRRRYAKSFKT